MAIFFLLLALAYSGIFGISLLSVMPHQEARFLTPLIIPLVVSLSGRISKLGRKFWVKPKLEFEGASRPKKS